MLEKVRKDVKECFKTLEGFYKKYGMDIKKFEKLQKEIDDFKVNVPLVGSFSSGKTSLLNVLLGEKLLSTAVVPETSLPYEITYAEEDRIYLYFRDGKVKELNKDDLKTQKFSVKEHKHIKLLLNKEVLKEIENLQIVDMPGFDSGIEEHDRAIYEYVPRSMAYIVVIDAETGSVKESVLDLLRNELKLFDLPFYVIVNKADKKKREIEEIIEVCRSQIKKALNVEDVRISATSARKGEIEPLKEFLKELNNRAEKLFIKKFEKEFQELKNELIKYLEFKLKHWEKDVSELELEEDKLREQIKEIDEKLRKAVEEIEKLYEETVEKIRVEVERELYGSLEELARILYNRGDIEKSIKRRIKRICFENFSNYFKPGVEEILKEIEKEIEDVDITIDLQGIVNIDETLLKKGVNNLLTAILVIIGSKIGGIIGTIIAAIISFIGEFLISEVKKKTQIEQIKRKLRETIPVVSKEIETQLMSKKENLVAQIRERIEEKMSKEKEKIEKAICDLKEEKRRKLEEQDKIRLEMEKDLEALSTLRC